MGFTSSETYVINKAVQTCNGFLLMIHNFRDNDMPGLVKQ